MIQPELGGVRKYANYDSARILYNIKFQNPIPFNSEKNLTFYDAEITETHQPKFFSLKFLNLVFRSQSDFQIRCEFEHGLDTIKSIKHPVRIRNVFRFALWLHEIEDSKSQTLVTDEFVQFGIVPVNGSRILFGQNVLSGLFLLISYATFL